MTKYKQLSSTKGEPQKSTATLGRNVEGSDKDASTVTHHLLEGRFGALQSNRQITKLIVQQQQSSSSAMPAGVEKSVVADIQQYDSVIDRVAVDEGIHPNLVRGIIAAESRGRAATEAASGYRGLMQAGRGNEQFDPETSIRTGIRKYLAFARNIQSFLRQHGADPGALTEPDVIRRVMVAYNAGPGTVKKAMEYALADGDSRLEHWLEPEHFQRALIYYGAYDVKGPLRSALAGLDGDALATELRALTGQSTEDLRKQYAADGEWQTANMRLAIVNAVNEERKQLRKQNLTIEGVRTQASHWIPAAVAFKHNNLRRWYLDRVVTYMQYFDQARPVQTIVIDEPEVIELD